MTPEELAIELRADGWHVERDGMPWRDTGVNWWAWRRLEGAQDCVCNEKPPNLGLTPWEHYGDNGIYRAIEVDVTGEIQGGNWVTFKAYSIPMDEALARLPNVSAVLLAAWNVAVSIQPTVPASASTEELNNAVRILKPVIFPDRPK